MQSRKIYRLWLVIPLLVFASAACRWTEFSAKPTSEPLKNSTPVQLPTTPTPIPTETAAPIQTTEPTFNALVFLPKITREYNEDPRFEVNFAYPYLQSDLPSAEKFNQEMERIVQNQITDARQAATEAETWRKQNLPESTSSIYATHTLDVTKTGLVGLVYSISSYAAGAAHPNNFNLTFNYDLTTGKVLTLEELFQSGTDYLGSLSQYCMEDLRSQNRLDFQEGVLPKPENFQNWAITSNGLKIVFDPYQVAPYASGTNEVLIPYQRIKDILRPDGPLGKLAK
jgi:hypothetical protein